MKADDEQIADRLGEITERRKQMDQRTALVIPLHLILEQMMSDYLHARNHKLAKNWAGKKQDCEELKPPEIEQTMWPVFKAINDLRNKIAHNLDQDEIQRRVDELRDAYLMALSPGIQRESARSLTDLQLIESAFQLCGSFIVVATMNAKKGT